MGRLYGLDLVLLDRHQGGPGVVETSLNVLEPEQVSEQDLVLVQGLVVDDQSQGELYLAVQDEGLEVLEVGILARGFVTGVEAELLGLQLLDRVDLLEDSQGLYLAEYVITQGIVLGRRSLYRQLQEAGYLLCGYVLGPGLT